MREKLEKIVSRSKELDEQMLSSNSGDFSQLAIEKAELQPIADLAIDYLALSDELKELQNIISDPEIDDDMKELANIDIVLIEDKIPKIKESLQLALLPKDVADDRNVILEIRAGTGGEEAALFAATLFHMYKRYAEIKKWKIEVLNVSETGLEGYKEISASITGKGVFAHLKYESGVHRVQRVPETESNGRVHTSAATVAVLPEAEEFDVNLCDEDLKIDVYRASGAGGQHVNTTESAVRITHIPTGVVVCQQDEKSQHKNKTKALKILRSRVYDLQRQQKQAERSAMRRGQIGSGDRSERIRTYNYPQGRITDHRVNVTSYNLHKVINEGNLEQFIDALITEDNVAKLSEATALV